MDLLGIGLVGAVGAAVAYGTRLLGPKVRAGDVKLVSTAGLYNPGALGPLLGAAPMFLMKVNYRGDDGNYYGDLIGAGVPAGVGTDLVQVTRVQTTPPTQVPVPVPESAFATNRWQG